MDRAMSVEERIRRAEERYNRKNRLQGDINGKRQYKSQYDVGNSAVNKKGNVKKLFMQMFICLSIYAFFYTATNSEYIFSENFKNDVGKFFTETIDINGKYASVKSYINEKILNNNIEEEKNKDESTTNENAEKNSDEANKEENSQENKEDKSESKEDNGVGGAEENVSNAEENNEKTQMEKDAEKIKSTISFIKPIEGKITSTFGWRNPSISTVPKYHTGTDIATAQGTKIKSATDGKVILASSEGDYGNHYQIKINDVIIIYAHCKVLYLKEGDTVTQGQEIAEVGSTGNSTGPHLHFEVMLQDRKVDPQLILDL